MVRHGLADQRQLVFGIVETGAEANVYRRMNRAAAAFQRLRAYGQDSIESVRTWLQAVSRFWRILLVHLFAWSFLTFAALATVLLSYLLLYFYYIPQERISQPVYFQYNEEQPSFRLDLNGLHPAVSYDVSLQLLVPDIAGLSESLGNVMLHTRLTPKTAIRRGEEARSSRPTLLVYRSWPARLALLVLRLVPVVLGLAREATTHRVFLFENVKPGVSQVEVTVQMGGRIPVYEATLEVVAHFEGLRYVMYYWRWAFGALLVGSLALGATLVITLLTGLSLYHRVSVVRGPLLEASEESDRRSAASTGLLRSRASSSFPLNTSRRSTARRRRNLPAELAVPDILPTTAATIQEISSGAESGSEGLGDVSGVVAVVDSLVEDFISEQESRGKQHDL